MAQFLNEVADQRPDQIADYLLCEARERGELLSNLKLQKLLFYADAWSLALFDKELFSEEFQAWVHGPVLPSQYHRFKDFKWRPITFDVQCPELDPRLALHLNEIMDVFGSEPAVALELMTHREKPWLDARGDTPSTDPSSAPISKAVTKEYYRSLR